MTTAIRKLLDELMGQERNLLPSEKEAMKTRRHFSDSDMCKFFLCGFCPLELTAKTKYAGATCPKTHDEFWRKEWERSKDKGKYPYEWEFIEECERMLTGAEQFVKARRSKEKQERLKKIEDELKVINDKLADDTPKTPEEISGFQGKVELMRTQREQLNGPDCDTLINALMARENVVLCEICGSVAIGDKSIHVEGKQHQGYVTMRELSAKIKEQIEARGDRVDRKPKDRARSPSRSARDDRRDERPREPRRDEPPRRDDYRRDEPRRDDYRRDELRRDDRRDGRDSGRDYRDQGRRDDRGRDDYRRDDRRR